VAATPSYQGAGQPSAGNGDGWLARIGSVFGGRAATSYAGNGQPAVTGGSASASTPAYASPPIVPASGCDPNCPIDPQALAEGKIAIVIPQPQ
jgi:hypothetical protein